MTEAAEESKAPADGAAKAQKAVKAPKEVSQMKAGDYTVHFLIQKAKDLEIDPEDVMQVICEIQVQSKKETSKVIKDVTNTTVVNFDSHVFVELMGQSVAELEQTKITIKLQEKGFLNNSLIGQVELDLTFIYNLENHTKQHSWMALINPDSEDFASIAAYLKISGSVYGVDDTPVELKMDENDDDDNCVMPASLKPKYTQLKMHIIKGENLPKLDFKMIGSGKMDAFVSAKIGGKTIKTQTKDTSKSGKEDEAVWNETFLIPIRMPIMSGKLILNVMDYDTVNDEQAGALIFNYKELLQREQKSFFWANIYGASGAEGLVASGGDLADEMNKDPSIATKWKGRLLIGIEHEFLDEKAPRQGCFPIETQPPKDADGNEQEGWQSMADLAKKYTEPVKYHLMYEFNSCINIPEKLGKYNLQLAIGEKTWTSEGGDKSRAVGYNYNRWNQRSDLIEFELPYGEVRDMEDIFLYLCPDKGGVANLFGGGDSKKVDDPISYCKIKAKDYENPNPKLEWKEMTEEPIEDKIDSPELAGVIGFRLSIIRADKVYNYFDETKKQQVDSRIDLKSQPNWKKALRRRPDSKKIRCYLFQCKDLPAADEDGASDPMVIVYNTVDEDSNKERMKKQVCETECIEDNCDPMFYQLLELKVDYTRGEPLPPFIFDVYDVDKNIVKSDDRDYMGRCVVDIDDVAKKYVCERATEETNQGDTTRREPGEIQYEGDQVDLKPAIPKWHPIRYAPGSPECGQILVSFVITEEFDHDWKTPNDAVKMMGLEDPTAVVDFSEYRVELNVLGLRNLISPGLLPVKKAYIDFLLKSMVPPMAAAALQSVQTQPGPSGPDPTINSVISFSVPMPKDYLFAPKMSCRVYDKVFKGMSGQLIGVFTIPTGEIMFNQNKEYDENCNSLDNIIKALKDVYEEKAVLDYEPVNKNQDQNLVEDKQFREQQRAQKQQMIKALAADPKEEKKSMASKIATKVASKVAPAKPVKPTSALSKRLSDGKKNQLKKRLILHTDEDTDSEGETTINPVAKQDTEKTKYIPPPVLDIGSINKDQPTLQQLDQLSRTPRSNLSQKQKQQVDGLAIRDVIEQKTDVNLLKNLTPKAGEKFKPPPPLRVSQNEIEQAIRSRSGANTPASANNSIRQFNSARTSVENKQMIKEAFINTEQAIQRETEASQQRAEKEMQGKEGGKELRMIKETVYQLDTRLNCMREIDIPDQILFESLGWDRTPGESTEKHYRKFFPKELETEPRVMSKPSEFMCYDLKRGQSRGAKKSLFDFGGGKADQATGEQDTTQTMGKFKALITVAKKDEEVQKKMFINNKLVEIRKMLARIYTKKFNKPFPLAEGFFCENTLEGSKVMTAEQRERRYSDDIKMPTNEDFAAQSSARSKTSFKFNERAGTILNQEGRAEFKAMIRAMKLTHLQILRKIVDVQSDEIIKRLLMSETKSNVRVYVVRAFNLAARDNDSPSDPYVKVILGDVVRDERDNYQTDEASPDIYKMFEFQAIFPGCPLLKVQFWDFDLLFGDDFIGETLVDLEDRYFSSDFKSFQHKPIEHRKLSHPSTEMTQGTVVMWAEINEQSAAKEDCPVWDISKKPEEEFEVRVVVWDTEDLEMMDAEGTTDGFIRVFFESDDRKDTDTHFRNQDGKCSWNYRLLFPFSYPSKNYKLTVQAYDLDLFKSNDLIGQAVIDLEPMIEDSDLAKRPMSLSKDYYEDYLKKERKWDNLSFVSDEPRQFWVNLTAKGDKGQIKINGKLKLQIDIVPKKEALSNPVGEAQSEPNVNPFLPKPFGRIEFSLNPFKMLNQLIGPALRRKIYCCCCIVICCALCVMMAPMIFSNMISNMLTPG